MSAYLTEPRGKTFGEAPASARDPLDFTETETRPLDGSAQVVIGQRHALFEPDQHDTITYSYDQLIDGLQFTQFLFQAVCTKRTGHSVNAEPYGSALEF